MIMKTPQTEVPALARALGLAGPVYLKREDLHPYGSHKGRSLPYMIKTYVKEGVRDFVISSSGNAAIAAVHTVVQHNKNNPQTPISLHIFVGEKIDKNKLKKLSAISYQLSAISIEQTSRPKQAALQYEKEHQAKLLRQSTDDRALEGYQELAHELDKIKNLQAIFIPTSSGTTAQALGEIFQTLDQDPQIHIVQTESCHPMVEEYPPLLAKEGLGEVKQSIASAIVDRVAHRKDKVVEVVKASGGAGWIVTDDEIKEAVKLAKQTINLDISPNSALAVAGLKKAVANGFSFSGPVVCLITGA